LFGVVFNFHFVNSERRISFAKLSSVSKITLASDPDNVTFAHADSQSGFIFIFIFH